MGAISTLEDLYVRQLQELLRAERRSVPVLAAMTEAAHDPILRADFAEHLEETREHAERVERLLDHLRRNDKTTAGETVEILIRQAGESVADRDPSPLQDEELIASAQRLNHYEIVAYGCAHTYAECLGDENAAVVLQEILDQEAEDDFRLSQLADKSNAGAMAFASAS